MGRKQNVSIQGIKLGGITRELFSDFQRRQDVTRCWRKVDGKWVIKDIAFVEDKLKGFVSVKGGFLGSAGQYKDLSCIHVSGDMRGKGIGKELFLKAKAYAKEAGGEKLYISAHSAVESQAFYRAMGCVEAEEYNKEHVEKEPCDCQLECNL